jgi:hypothetical protein
MLSFSIEVVIFPTQLLISIPTSLKIEKFPGMNEEQYIRRFPIFGWIGLSIIFIAELLLVMNIKIVEIFFTPIVWTGYILFIDAFLHKQTGNAYLIQRRRLFFWMLPASLGCWLIFEAYNLHLMNWEYINLPENMIVRIIGYVWSFITIFPGVLLTSEVIDHLEIFERFKTRNFVISKKTLIFWLLIGALFLIVPLILPMTYSKYLFALVWMGFVFLLDPINAFLGEHSLFMDLRAGKINKLFSLFLSGVICGFLWEFWNYWAITKWIYILPFLQEPKIFEMPVVGFLGFLPFAVECYVMWIFIKFIIQKLLKVEILSEI